MRLRVRPRLWLPLMLCLLAVGVQAQQLPVLWLQGGMQYRSAKRLIVEADASARAGELGLRPFLAHVRAGAGLQWTNGFATAGAAWFQTFDTTGAGAHRGELRLHQRLQLRQSVGPVELAHVYRAEERWIERADLSTFDLRFRFRYMLQGTWRWKSANLLQATPYAIAHVESMLSPDPRVFSQLRVYGGLGLDWKSGWRYELAFMQAWLPAQPTGTTQQQFVRTILSRTIVQKPTEK